MLVLTRKRGQRITIGNVVITITHTGKTFTRIGIEAPNDVPICRDDAKSSIPTDNPPTALTANGR